MPRSDGAATANIIYRIDITKIDIPAKVPIRFSEVMPFEAIQRKIKKSTKHKDCTNSVDISLTKVPSPLTAQPSAMRIACGFWAR